MHVVLLHSNGACRIIQFIRKKGQAGHSDPFVGDHGIDLDGIWYLSHKLSAHFTSNFGS